MSWLFNQSYHKHRLVKFSSYEYKHFYQLNSNVYVLMICEHMNSSQSKFTILLLHFLVVTHFESVWYSVKLDTF